MQLIAMQYLVDVETEPIMRQIGAKGLMLYSGYARRRTFKTPNVTANMCDDRNSSDSSGRLSLYCYALTSFRNISSLFMPESNLVIVSENGLLESIDLMKSSRMLYRP